MLKCPFCHFNNEDGALFCEQCKSDLAGAVVMAAPVAMAQPAHAVPMAQTDPVPVVAALPVEEVIPLAHAEPIPVMADPFPLAAAEIATPIPLDPEPVVPATPIAVDAIPAAAPAATVPPSMTAAPPFVAPAMLEPVAITPTPAAPAPVAAAPVAPSAPTVPAAPSPTTPDAPALPPDAQPRLLVLRGQKRNVEYPIYEGLNFIGRADDKPVDIDLEDQEPPDRIWCSRQHACISFEGGQLAVEDLNSANGTYVNRGRIYPGQKRPLAVNDIIQIGNVQMKVIV
jgi:hypothetical protein